jgi:hypothetical protein
MTEAVLIESLRKIRDLVDEALAGVSSKPSRKPRSRAPASDNKQPTDGLPGHISRLRDEGFFKQPQTAAEVHAKLQSSYHCDLNRVAVALLRLFKKRVLRKTSKTVGGKPQVAYVV